MKKLALLILAASITGGWTCSGEKFDRVCAKYVRGSDWANKAIKERLDTAALLAPPAWSASYLAARNIFVGADTALRSACNASELEKMKPEVISASEAMRTLVALHDQIAGESSANGPVMRAGAPPLIDTAFAPPPGLDADLAEVISVARER